MIQHPLDRQDCHGRRDGEHLDSRPGTPGPLDPRSPARAAQVAELQEVTVKTTAGPVTRAQEIPQPAPGAQRAAARNSRSCQPAIASYASSGRHLPPPMPPHPPPQTPHPRQTSSTQPPWRWARASTAGAPARPGGGGCQREATTMANHRTRRGYRKYTTQTGNVRKEPPLWTLAAARSSSGWRFQIRLFCSPLQDARNGGESVTLLVLCRVRSRCLVERGVQVVPEVVDVFAADA